MSLRLRFPHLRNKPPPKMQTEGVVFVVVWRCGVVCWYGGVVAWGSGVKGVVCFMVWWSSGVEEWWCGA